MLQSSLTKEHITVLKLAGSLDLGAEGKLKQILLDNIPAPVKKVILDFKGVDFIDSACLGILVSVTRDLRAKGGDLCLCAVKSEVLSVLQITRLNKVFKVCKDAEEALANFSA